MNATSNRLAASSALALTMLSPLAEATFFSEDFNAGALGPNISPVISSVPNSTSGTRTWGQLFDQFGDLVRHTSEVVRYTEPNGDPNRSRRPNHLLWETVVAEMNDDLTEMRSGADPNPMKEVHKETHISLLQRNILGTTISLAALNGVDINGIGPFLEMTGKDMKCMALGDLAKTEKQLNTAKDRYVFVSDPARPQKG